MQNLLTSVPAAKWISKNCLQTGWLPAKVVDKSYQPQAKKLAAVWLAVTS